MDFDLASLYGVSTKRLNDQVKRKRQRFPLDFMFQLSREETESLRSQFATSSAGHGGRRYRPYAFTEHGAVMLASVLNSMIAVEASVQVVRAFVRLRRVLATHKELAAKLAELETRIETHDEASLRSDSLKNCRNLRQNLVHDRIGYLFQPSAVACAEIERAGLVAADNAGCFSTGACQRYRKSGGPREVPAAGDWENHGHLGDLVKGVGGDDQDRAPALLLVSFRGIKAHHPDFATPHQISSRPTGWLSSHSRSSFVRRALESHWASSSSRV